MPLPDPARVLRRIRRGDGAAFAVFYDAYFESCVERVRTRTRRGEDFCLDVVQDVMLVVSEKPPKLPDTRSFEAWLHKTLLHHAIDRIRKEARRERHEAAVAVPQDASQDEQAEARMIAAEERAWLARELAALPEVDRTLVEARFFESNTLEASGARVGLGVHAAHGRIRRTLRRLRKLARGKTTTRNRENR